MPLVSIVMPVYNCEAFVEDAVRSVLAQTEQDFELIIVDDGSTDATPTILAALAREDKRIKVRTQENSGKASIARNLGVSLASAEFVTFLDADDLFHPRRIERCLDVFALLPDVDLVFSDLVHFASNKELTDAGHLARLHFLEMAASQVCAVGVGVYRCGSNFFNFLSTRGFGVVTPQTVMMRRQILESEPVWFPEQMATYEDNDLWLRLAIRYRFAYIHEVLAYYRQHSASITCDEEAMATGAILAKTRNLRRGKALLSTAERRYCRHVLSQHYFNLGYHFSQRNRSFAALKAYLSGLRFYPTTDTLVAVVKLAFPRSARDLARRALRR